MSAGGVMQGVRWVFTIHFGSLDEAHAFLDDLPNGVADKPFGTYGGAQVEVCPTTGSPHIQGWCGWPKGQNQRLSAVKKVHGTAHWEVMRGKISQNVQYCSKSATSVSEYKTWGEVPEDKQGQRSDLEAAAELLVATEGSVAVKMRAVANAHKGAFVKYHKGFEALAQATKKPTYLPPIPEFWRPWQLALKFRLEGPSDNRSIVWVRDTVGGKGKSTLSNYFCAYHPEMAIDLNGKINDMRYAYAKEPKKIVFFDVSRTTAEHMDHLYSFAEELKNGKFMSGKYESTFTLFEPPHVVFLSNSMYQEGKWSADRVYLIDLDVAEMEGGMPVEAPAAGGAGGFSSVSLPVPQGASSLGSLFDL